MGHTESKDGGSFEVSGCSTDLDILGMLPNPPDPYVAFKHSCNVNGEEDQYMSPVRQIFEPEIMKFDEIML